jgi:hypothetical protein
MNARRLNLVLWTAAGLFLVAAVLVVIAGATVPLDRVVVNVRAPTTPTTRQAPRAADASWADGDWSRPLRGPLTGAATAAATSAETSSESATQPAGPLTLLGTIGDSLAIVSTADGSVATVGPLDHVGDALVTAIRPSEIDVNIGGRSVTIRRAAGPELPTLTPGPPAASAGTMPNPMP